MRLAPEPILRAGNETIYWACVFCRNQFFDGSRMQMVNEVMEAIHEVPKMLVNWENHDLNEIRNHLACFDAARWRDASGGPPFVPDLVAYFNERLVRYGYDGDGR